MSKKKIFDRQWKADDTTITLPMRWKKPRMIFVNSTFDLFHEDVPFEYIDWVFAVMALCPHHTFQVLTKRPERMRQYLSEKTVIRTQRSPDCVGRIMMAKAVFDGVLTAPPQWPLPNVWLGVSIEDQATADARIPHLLATPAAVRFISAEPLLGPVNFSTSLDHLDLVIVGGESGPGARPMNPDWARSLRDQCQAAGVAFFFKQWGAFSPGDELGEEHLDGAHFGAWVSDTQFREDLPQDMANANTIMFRVGKKAAGRMLDGREWNEMPEVKP